VKTGGDSWFFITADYAFGHALERDTEAVVLKNGGRCSARCGTRSTRRLLLFLLQAQSSKPRSSGWRTRRRHHQQHQAGREFGIVKGGQNLAGLLVFITDVHALGLQTPRG